jgi:two-component system sensor histidine kinase GlrK
MLKKRIVRPWSFPLLILAGFVVVAIPLLGGILRISYLLEDMTREGQRSVTLSAEITLLSRQLTEAGRHLKRTAGQYFVLEDPALKQRLANAHLHFSEILEQLRKMPWEPPHKQILDHLAQLEEDLYAKMRQVDKADAEHFEQFKEEFDELSVALATISEQTAMIVQRQVAIMNGRADRMQQEMFWQAVALILMSAILAFVLSWLISRPVQQLSLMIRRLGKNDLSHQVQIHGPKDMVYLGDQLDWLRQRLQDLEASKLAFFREVSHELKTPLTILLEAVTLLSDKVVGELTEQQEEVIAIMNKSAENLRQRIEVLLSYNETLRQSDSSCSWFDLSTLIDEVTARLDLLLRAKKLQLIDSIVTIQLFADREGLSVAIENLLSNAVKFSPEGGIIEMTADMLADKLSILICDQGPGIPEADVSKLFQPFFKGIKPEEIDKSSAGKLKSSGLGLAIAKAHIEGQGGQLELVPLSGRGACFRITLPLKEEESISHAQ